MRRLVIEALDGKEDSPLLCVLENEIPCGGFGMMYFPVRHRLIERELLRLFNGDPIEMIREMLA